MFRRRGRFSTLRRRRFRRRFSKRGGRFARQKFDRIILFSNFQAGPVENRDTMSQNGLGFCLPISIVACNPTQTPAPCGPASECADPLDPQFPTPCGCCVTQAQFNLLGNDTLESYFQDSVTVVRIYGDIFYRALVAFPSFQENCSLDASVLQAYNELYSQGYAEQWHWSLRKHLRTQSGDETVPLDANGPVYDYDWTEGSPPWLWQRVKFWAPPCNRRVMSMTHDSILGVCSNTSRPLYNVPAEASGARPAYDVPAESTLCQAYAPGSGGEVDFCPQTYSSIETKDPPWHRLRVSIRKHIKLQRDNDLNLSCHIRHPQITDIGGWNCMPKSLFAPDFSRAFDTNYEFYLRLAAVVRLN